MVESMELLTEKENGQVLKETRLWFSEQLATKPGLIHANTNISMQE